MTGTAREEQAASAERRAEELVERVVSDGARWLSWAVGRVREEVEDIVAEGQELHRRSADGEGAS